MDRFEELKLRYARSLPQKATELAAAWARFSADADDAQARRALHQCVHRLSGAAPAFGLEQLGDAAQAVDGQFSDWMALPEFERLAPVLLQRAIAADMTILLAAMHAHAAAA